MFIFYIFFIGNHQYSINVDLLPKIADTTNMSKKPSSTNVSVDIPITSKTPVSPSPIVVNDSRTHLLNSITDFDLSKLKQTKSNDRSNPNLK